MDADPLKRRASSGGGFGGLFSYAMVKITALANGITPHAVPSRAYLAFWTQTSREAGRSRTAQPTTGTQSVKNNTAYDITQR